MRVQLMTLRAEDDTYNKGDSGPDAHFKRLRAEGVADFGAGPRNFLAFVDYRARLFTVRAPRETEFTSEHLRQIGVAIINEVAQWLPRPIGHLVKPVVTTSEAEWMLTEADHMSGLLHRLREHKEFCGRSAPPVPAELRMMLMDFVAVTIESIGRVFEMWDEQSNLRRDRLLILEIGIWEAHRVRFLDLVDDVELRNKTMTFFERLGLFERVWKIAHDYLKGREPTVVGGTAIGLALQLKNELHDDGRRLVKLVADQGAESKLDSRIRQSQLARR